MTILRLVRTDLETEVVTSAYDLQPSIYRAVFVAAAKQRKYLRDAARVAAKAVKPAMQLATDFTSSKVSDLAPSLIADEQAKRNAFEERLEGRWREGLGYAELCRILCLQAGMDFHHRNMGSNSPRYLALSKLHAKGCLVAYEILALLRSGFASGAHARWRVLHEVAVIAEFLSKGDDDLSERYLLYGHVESLAAVRDYQKHAEDLRHDPFGEEEIEEMKARQAHLCERFGSHFKKSYGWAVPPFAKPPNFRRIEEATEIGHYRPYYRMASHPNHAGPKGIAFDIGLAKDQGEVMLAGPSNVGLSDPGHGMCISLSQLTATFLLSSGEDAGLGVTLSVILSISDATGEAFNRARLEQEEQEAAKVAAGDVADGD